MRYTRRRYVDQLYTPSQLWAQSFSACFDGRSRLGRHSIGQWWHSPQAFATDLIWIARHLHPQDQAYWDAYKQAVDGVSQKAYGRWALVHTRRRLEAVFATYNVQIPARLL